MTNHTDKAVARVREAIDQIQRGGMVIMVDDEDRENEGDLVFGAQFASPDKINFMAKEARGLICLTLNAERTDLLQLPLMNQSGRGGERSTAFTLSIEAKSGVSTGISAKDRAHTIQVAIADNASAADLVVPGHVFPLRAKEGGVLERAGHTEGSVDLARLAGLKPAAVICEIMKDDGTMARLPDLESFAKSHHLPIVCIADLITYRLMHDSLIEEVESGMFATECGTFSSYLFRSTLDQSIHLALVKGNPSTETPVDVRVHRQRPLLDVFGQKSDGSDKISYGMQLLKQSENGVFIYLNPGNMGEEILAEYQELTRKPSEDSSRLPSSSPSQRLYGIGAQILRRLGVKKMIVHAVAPKSLKALSGFGLEIIEVRTLS